MSKRYEYDGEPFCLLPAPNGYLVVTHGGPVGSNDSSLVGYVGAREDGTDDHPYGWVTPREFPTGKHTHRGLAYSHVASPPTIEGQLNALCQHFLDEMERDAEEARNHQEFDPQNTRGEISDFFTSLPDA